MDILIRDMNGNTIDLKNYGAKDIWNIDTCISDNGETLIVTLELVEWE